MGLSFSVPPGVRVPLSLQNMYKELAADLDCKVPNHGCLEKVRAGYVHTLACVTAACWWKIQICITMASLSLADSVLWPCTTVSDDQNIGSG